MNQILKQMALQGPSVQTYSSYLPSLTEKLIESPYQIQNPDLVRCFQEARSFVFEVWMDCLTKILDATQSPDLLVQLTSDLQNAPRLPAGTRNDVALREWEVWLKGEHLREISGGKMTRDIYAEIGLALMKYRAENNLSQEKLAEMLSVKRLTISRLENGHNAILMADFLRWRKILNTELVKL